MEDEHILNIGFDDTDSPKGMCTTFLAFKIVALLKKQNTEFLDFPKLIRFNPNIPWKTRGNGAVSLKIKTNNPSKIKNQIKTLIEKYSDIKNGANPGLVFYENEKIPKQFSDFSRLALWQLINRKKAKLFAQKNNLEIFYQGNGQGLVGAIGAIGYDFDDHTLELLSYRKHSKFGKKRNLSPQSVKKMQEKTEPFTFNSFDYKKDKVLITPHGPDPVFYGVRGENLNSLLKATKILETKESLAGYMVFKSNQGTGDHLKNELDQTNLKPYASGKITGYVSSVPKIIQGGHVYFSIVSNNVELPCAVYKPTGMTSTALGLIQGDKICIGGGIRKSSKNYPRILNIEFIDVLELQANMTISNPLCNDCNKKMKSKGKNQGYQCLKCGKRSKNKNILEIPRIIKKQLYLPDLSAHRHLSRPRQRIGRINLESKFYESASWFHLYEN